MSVAIRQLSDLHLERLVPKSWQAFIDAQPTDGVDVLALCGDISGPDIALVLGYFATHFKDAQVLYVPGNHEYYQRTFSQVHADILSVESEFDNFTWLRPDVRVTVNDRDFIGHTLWYPGTQKARDALNRSLTPGWAGFGLAWSDFEWIKRPAQIFQEAIAAEAWFRKSLGPGDIVITHMLPAWGCITPRWRNKETNMFFVHDLGDLIHERKPAFWMHGHTHDSTNCVISDTPVHCNPGGYPGHMPNPDFDPELTHVI